MNQTQWLRYGVLVGIVGAIVTVSFYYLLFVFGYRQVVLLGVWK